ncbi:MAG: right-handed parallel beta-helix repeat-containing protein [Archangium sp.]|nr:right-handed parallel beta-helix repeat-containing protein [Archangium sp.]
MRSFALLLLLTACGPLTPKGTAPQGLKCDRVLIPPVSLAETLATVQAGDCVILPSGTYEGSFVLPEDVSLAASDRAAVTLTGGDPVLTVRGGPRSIVQGIRVLASTGGGIAIEPGPVALIGVTVSGSQKSAVTSTCTRPDCDSREVVLTDCELTQSAVGLRSIGARVRVEGGRIAEQTGQSLSAGSGVVASAGARLTLHGVTIEGNQNIGVLIDGAATRATLDGCTVKDNLGRGVWAQGQTAAAGEATVTVSGGEVSGNALMGIGARDSTGLVIRDVTVQDTRAVREPIDISTFEEIGDGIALFTGTTSATIENVISRRNARAQLLADGCGQGVSVAGATVSGGRYRVVVQRTVVPIVVEPTLIDAPGADLAVRAGAIELAP